MCVCVFCKRDRQTNLGVMGGLNSGPGDEL